MWARLVRSGHGSGPPVPTGRLEEDAPTLAAKSYTTHHLSVGVGRCVALSNTHMLLNTHTHTDAEVK